MHILIAAIAAIGGLIWAINHLMNGAAEAKSTVRRLRWQGRQGKDVFSELDDPRVAAVVLLGQLRRYDGDISQADRVRFTELVEKEFRTPKAEAEEIVSYGLYALGQKTDAANDLAKLLGPIREHCEPSERADLLRLMTEVCKWDGIANDMQIDLVDRTRQRLMD
ncbi:MAG: TerB family tellurite resistance protein [Pseudomonadota bacterium]